MPTSIRNRTKYRLRVNGAQAQALLLAPFERRELTEDELLSYNPIQMTRQGLIAIEDTSGSERASMVLGLAVWAAIIYVAVGFWLGNRWFWIGGAVALALLVGIGFASANRGFADISRWARQTMSMVIMLGIGIGIPVVAVWFATSLADFSTNLRNAHQLFFEATSRRLIVARSLQVGFISIVSLLPGLMYYLFDRARLGALRDQFVRDVFRLDPALATEADLAAKYGSQMEESFGSSDPHSTDARFAAGRRSPVLVATLLVVIGWTFILLNPSVGPLGTGNTVPPFELVDLFVPQLSAVAFGFLGAYFFTLRVIRRGYVRGDLKPKTYTNLTVRLILVIILAWVLETMIPEPTWLIYPTAFLAGLIPDTWLKAISDQVSRLLSWGSGTTSTDLADELSLTNIEGIDIYDRSRLEDEGVNNVEALAHADLVGLMLRTRIPVPQLVDWVDQAILFLHVYRNTDLFSSLHAAGIRTASDLIQTWDKAKESNDIDGYRARLEVAPEPGTRSTLQIIVDTLDDEEWLNEIQFWRAGDDAGGAELMGAVADGDTWVVDASTISPTPVIRRALQDSENAEAILREALQHLPDSSELVVLYARLMYIQGTGLPHREAESQYRRSLQYFERALDLVGENASLLADKSLVLFSLNLDAAAVDSIASARQSTSNPVADLEMAFYEYAFDPDRYGDRIDTVMELLDFGVRSEGWPLDRMVERAAARDRTHGEIVGLFAVAIGNSEPWEAIRPQITDLLPETSDSAPAGS